MSQETKKPFCGNCEHYLQNPGEPRGECYLNPPSPVPSGGQLRPKVTKGTHPCSHHKMLPDNQPPAEFGKKKPLHGRT